MSTYKMCSEKVKTTINTYKKHSTMSKGHYQKDIYTISTYNKRWF